MAISSVTTDPANSDASAEIASAGPARPRWAMAWPSSTVITEEVSPGILIRMAVVEPPYCAP